ncbi:MAG TPA: TetR family transcriptional regulator [Candidatus Blautia avistercoris]|nr:TetR family transcriptional regulator [Candidatus Blautia avistercoris]
MHGNWKREKKEELVFNRQQEIIQACERLYAAMEYEEINIKEIAKSTSICRSSIYNYYKTKDEIFLDILRKEYFCWLEDLKEETKRDKEGSRESYCRILAESAARHPRLLELISFHYVTIEKNCSLEKLTDFKKGMLPFWNGIRESLREYFPEAPQEKKEHFLLVFLSLLQGIYTMTNLSEKQLAAMKQADGDYEKPRFVPSLQQALYTLSKELL